MSINNQTHTQHQGSASNQSQSQQQPIKNSHAVESNKPHEATRKDVQMANDNDKGREFTSEESRETGKRSHAHEHQDDGEQVDTPSDKHGGSGKAHATILGHNHKKDAGSMSEKH